MNSGGGDKINHDTRIIELDGIIQLYERHVSFYGRQIASLQASKEKKRKILKEGGPEYRLILTQINELKDLEVHLQVDYAFLRSLAHNLKKSRSIYIQNVDALREIGSLDD